MKARTGFTLIELLVVIAIIGILSSVVLASLNSARNRGADANIKANLNNARGQAELYYDSGATPTYVGVCTSTSTGIANLVAAASSTAGQSDGNNCQSSTSTWAAWARLKGTSGKSFCVDNTGAAREVNTITANTTACPAA